MDRGRAHRRPAGADGARWNEVLADANPIALESLVALLDAESRRRKNGHRRTPVIERLLAARPLGRPRFVSAADARARRARLQKRIDRAQALIAGAKKILGAARLPGQGSLAGLSTTLRTLALQAAFREQTLDQYLPFVLGNRYVFESESIRAAYA